jgi:hypothetical protein
VYRESGFRSPLRSFTGAAFDASAIKIAGRFTSQTHRPKGFP